MKNILAANFLYDFTMMYYLHDVHSLINHKNEKLKPEQENMLHLM